MFYGMSQFVTSQNFQNVTGKAQLSQVFWYFFHVYVTSTSLLLHYTTRNTCQYRRVNDKFHNFTISEKRNHYLMQHKIPIHENSTLATNLAQQIIINIHEKTKMKPSASGW